MADYTKMKNAELEALLKERSLPHTGKKADLVKRLQDSDNESTSEPAPAAAAPKAADDEIDWDDDAPATTEASKATTEPAAAAIAAGGQGEVGNPQAVPNQVADIDPATTNDLTVSQPADAPATSTDDAPAAAPVEEPAKPAVDFSSGLAKTTLDQEIEKRKARAKKFGMDESADETLKSLERQKKFGGTDTDMTGRLNEALPEKRERKRGRDATEDAGGRKKSQRPAAGGRGNDSGRRNEPRGPAPKKTNGASGSWMSEADKARADKRKAKFA